MNKVILVGRLTRAPELKKLQSEKTVTNFSVAVDRRFKRDDGPSADFFNVVAWGRQGEVICQYLDKGSPIAISGRLENRSWMADGGSKRYATDVILEEFTFIGGGKGQSADGAPEQAGFDFDDEFKILSDNADVPF